MSSEIHNKFVQFMVWRDCHCNCDYCYLKDIKSDKLVSLNFIIQALDESYLDEYNEIGFIGGEIFGKELNSKEIKELFYKIIDKVIERINKKLITKFYITANLLYSNLINLTEFIDYCKKNNILEYVLLCTSYDTIGRFKNQNSENLWKRNINYLHQVYPDLNIHTEMILTQDLIEKVINNKFNFSEFQKEYNTKVNFIQLQCDITNTSKEEFVKKYPKFLPKRKSFLKFLTILAADPSINLNEFLNMNLHASVFYHEYNGKIFKIERSKGFKQYLEDYSNTVNGKYDYLGYSDSSILLKEDVETFKNAFI